MTMLELVEAVVVVVLFWRSLISGSSGSSSDPEPDKELDESLLFCVMYVSNSSSEIKGLECNFCFKLYRW